MGRLCKQRYNRLSPVLALASAMLATALGSNVARAEDVAANQRQANELRQVAAVAPAKPNNRKPARGLARPYYIEFRSRSAQSYGHTFAMYGRLDGRGKIASSTVTGLHPISESPVPWMIGHLIIVPSETGPSDGDTEDQYVTARFRVTLTPDEYKRVTTYIGKLRKSSPVWHAVLNNCNTYVGDIARFMGLKTPLSTMEFPPDYINGLRDLNMSRTNLADVIGTPVKVADANELRAEALRALERREKRAATSHRRSTKNATPVSSRQSDNRHHGRAVAFGHL